MIKKLFWLVIIVVLGYAIAYFFIYRDEDLQITIKPAVLWNKIKDRVTDKDLPVKKMINSVKIDMSDVSSKSSFIEKETNSQKKNKKKEYTRDDHKIIDNIMQKIN